MNLKKLASSFYLNNPKIIQALEFDMTTTQWMGRAKVRGHGVVQIKINNLIFAIPVRSNVEHDESYILEVDRRNNKYKGMGLDYAKALLIHDESYVSEEIFLLKSKAAGRKLIGKEKHITEQFEQYVEKYIKALKNKDKNILNSKEYRHTTLVNYHSELSIE